jgi:hypothetical protein
MAKARYIDKILDAQSGTGESSLMSFSGNLMRDHTLSVTTSAAGSALVIELIDGVTGQEIISHTATSGELSDQAFTITADGYPIQSAKVNVGTNTGAGNITVVYHGLE